MSTILLCANIFLLLKVIYENDFPQIYTIMKIKLLLTILLELTQTFVFSYITGDWRSTKSGLWNYVFIWQYYDGSYWVIPSVNCTQGYPSKYSATAGAVLIQSDHTIFINKPAPGRVAKTTQLMGTVTI